MLAQQQRTAQGAREIYVFRSSVQNGRYTFHQLERDRRSVESNKRFGVTESTNNGDGSSNNEHRFVYVWYVCVCATEKWKRVVCVSRVRYSWVVLLRIAHDRIIYIISLYTSFRVSSPVSLCSVEVIEISFAKQLFTQLYRILVLLVLLQYLNLYYSVLYSADK